MSVENKSDPKPIKDEKCPLVKKLYSATIRLTVALREPDEESCSVFNYITLISGEKRNRRHEKEKLALNEKEKLALNGNLEENVEADEEIKKLAQHFEEKYGGGNTKKKKKKKAPTFYNYTELAAGYDENDSFIDNSEAFDEALPDEMETIHGGYYVNVGQLQFKKVELGEDTSEFEEIRVGKKKSCVLKSDDSDSEGDSSKSDIDKSESVDDEAEAQHKKLPEETNHNGVENAKSVSEVTKTNVSEKLKPEKCKENVPSNGLISMNGELLVKKRKKYKKRRLEEEDGPVDGLSKPKKKALTVKSLLEEKRVVVENGEPCTAVPKVVAAAATTTTTTTAAVASAACGNANAHNSYNDVIESVVNAARNEDSRDSTCSSSDTKSIDSRTSYDTEKDSHHDDMEITEVSGVLRGFHNIPKEQIKLPDNLPSDVLELISQIKSAAQNTDLGVRTFFNPYINPLLLSLEIKVRPLMSNVRHALYGHLSDSLPCSKDTLMKRAKKLLIEEEEKHMVEPFKKLKANIDRAMPALLNNYEVAYQKVIEEKAGDSIKNGEADEKKTSPKLPSKKFIWTEESRACLRDLAACRLKCFHMLKLRKESPDDYVRKFLETRVKPLWPTGWMDTSTLWKESHPTNITGVKSKRTSATIQNTPPQTAASSTSTVTTASTTTTAKKSAHSSVPSTTNANSAVAGMSAAELSNLLSLQSSLAMYSQSDLGYPITTSPSIAYGHDLSLLTAAAGSNIPLTMDLLSRLAQFAPKMSTHQAYTKVKSPPKKQSPSPGFSSSRSTTPHSNPSANSFADAKKSEKMLGDVLTKCKEMMKMDASANKTKKEFVLNHISQYNKHYSHKTEKRKSAGHERKEGFSGTKTTSSSSSVSTHTTIAPANAKAGACEVLDLSPNKTTKSETKGDIVLQSVVDHHRKTESSTGTTNSVSAAKDHNYWSNSIKKEDVAEVREIKHEKAAVLPLIQRSVSIPAETPPPPGPSLTTQVTPKPTTHISRKQRILQESAKSAAQEVYKTSETPKSSSRDSTKLIAQSSVSSKESTYKHESRERSNVNVSKDDRLHSIKEEKKSSALEEKQMREETANATDILSKIINDTLQNNTPLQPQFTNSLFENHKIKQEVKTEDELHITDFIKEAPCQTSTPIRESQSSGDTKSSSSTAGAGRKTPSNERAEIEAADVINDLLALNQIGGRSSMRRLDYQDSRYIDNRHLPAEINFTNGSTLSQSSPHSANNSKTSSIPRLNLTGFQDEFLQHIFKMDRDHSSYNSNSVPQDISTDFISIENSKSSFNNHVSKSSVKPGNSSVYNNYQSVIMPPSSVKWHTPESKS